MSYRHTTAFLGLMQADNLPPGMLIGGCFILSKQIARTNMSAVYLARDICSNCLCVVKRLAPSPQGLAPQLALRAFLREAKILASVQGPFPKLISLDRDAFGWYMVQEYITGQTLAQVLADNQLPLSISLAIAEGIVYALLLLQQNRLVYGDLHPRNVIVRADNSVVLIDMGLTRPIGFDPPELRGIGTPGYASPEQAAGLPIDSAADVYALGAILIQLLEESNISRSVREMLDATQMPLRIDRNITLVEISKVITHLRADEKILRSRYAVKDRNTFTFFGTSHERLFNNIAAVAILLSIGFVVAMVLSAILFVSVEWI